MNEYLLVFYRDYTTPEIQLSPDKNREYDKHWADWLRGLAATDKLGIPVQRFDPQGKVVNWQSPRGPFTEINQSMVGIIMIKARDYTDAVEIARDCPVLELGGTVEVRQAL
jgi:hypothetical protein